ncbi:DNA-binding protein H-NS [Tranquillimonas rosea]|uniref:DNA-binding protein H-NS n=1 Tax=Tranquillimonas rosea TaxID=641238 RepID=A0A1H9SBL2_9RHOB|nr:H-NS histone family protein [Tranquillimonas rosea]SER82426.1 DNA-binding protein H-NS [Tranquillimonas rosea]
MDRDLQSMSKKELEDLRAAVDKALKDYDARKKAEARKAAEEAAKVHGFSLDDLVSGKVTGAQKNPPKYRNPDDPKKTWTGRGRQPAWIKEALDSGRSLEDFRI